MRKQKEFVLSVFVIVLLVAAGPVAAAEIDWDNVKSVWNTLTPDEQDAYRAQMPAQASARGTVRAFGKVVPPSNRAPGDTCGAATQETGGLPYSDSDTTVGLADDYDIVTSATCNTGFDSSGADNVYLITTDATCDVTVTESGGNYDVVLWAVTDCADADNTCAGSSDGGNPENFTFTATGGTDYWVIVDGWSGQEGDYTLDLTESTSTGCGLIPVELESFNVFSVD